MPKKTERISRFDRFLEWNSKKSVIGLLRGGSVIGF